MTKINHITPEMIEAAEDAYQPFGDMEMALMCAFDAYPEQDEKLHKISNKYLADRIKELEDLKVSNSTPLEWQPIETAPKDDTILVCTWNWQQVVFWDNENNSGWLCCCKNIPLPVQPTHWQPLQEPPSC